MFAIYAFCREVDDIADNLRNSKALKEKKLNLWKKILAKYLKTHHWIQSLKRELNYSIINLN